jgi:hypothetical protein
MLKHLSILVVFSACSLGIAAAYKTLGGDRADRDDRASQSRDGQQESSRSNRDREHGADRSRSDESIPEFVVVRGARIDISRLSPKAQARVRALMQQLVAAQGDLQMAERDVGQASRNISQARESLAEAQIPLNSAIRSMYLNAADYQGQMAQHHSSVALGGHVDGYINSVMGGNGGYNTPITDKPSPSSVLHARAHVIDAQQQYAQARKSTSYAVRRAENDYQNSLTRVESARASLLRAESEIIDLVTRG